MRFIFRITTGGIPTYARNCPPEVRVAGVVTQRRSAALRSCSPIGGATGDAIVTTTDAIASRVIAANPGVAARVRTIPIGVPVPTLKARGDLSKRPLRLLYHGGLIQYQKRVLDLPKIVEAALGLGVPVDLTLFGDGADRDRLAAAGRRLIESRRHEACRRGSPCGSDGGCSGSSMCICWPPSLRGCRMPLVIAMAGGCVPIATNIRSGVRELVRDGENGFIVPVGDIAAFADRLAILYADPVRRAAMSEQSAERGYYRWLRRRDHGGTLSETLRKSDSSCENRRAVCPAPGNPPACRLTR